MRSKLGMFTLMLCIVISAQGCRTKTEKVWDANKAFLESQIKNLEAEVIKKDIQIKTLETSLATEKAARQEAEDKIRINDVAIAGRETGWKDYADRLVRDYGEKFRDVRKAEEENKKQKKELDRREEILTRREAEVKHHQENLDNLLKERKK